MARDSFDSLAHTAAGLMGAIGIDRADVLGWSMGDSWHSGSPSITREGHDPDPRGHEPGGSRSVLGTRKAQTIDSKPNPSDDDILHELYPPDRQAEGHRFLHRLVTASQSGEIPNDFHVPSSTTDAQVAARTLAPKRPELPGAARHPRATLAAAGRQDPVVPPVNL